jgi:hypothetical protein
MPSWKKVITSGSDAALNSINVTNGVTITGSLNVTGSTTQVGNNTLLGNTLLSGSLTISGSSTPGSPTAAVQIYGDIRQSGYHRFDPVTTNIDTSVTGSYIYVSGSTNDLYFSQNGSGYNNVTRLRWLEGNLYTGLLHGGLITTASSTVYRISSGSGIIVNLNASLTNDPYPIVQFLQWGNLSASIAPFTASYQQVFVGIDATNNIFAQGTPFSNGQFDSIINIGGVFFQNQSTINGVKTQPSVAYGFEQQQNTFNRAFGPLKLSGYTLATSGSSTGSLIVASGTAYAPGSNYTVDPNEPYYAVDNGTNVSKIFRYRQSGSTWVYDTNAGAGYATIDPTRYSNNGVLTAVPGGGSNRQWSIQRVFWFPNSVIKAIVVYYGNATYTTELDAIANISFETFVEAPNTSANAIYLGAIVVRNNADFTNTDSYKIQPGGLFRQVGGSGGGGSIITQTLSGLSDVLISGPTDGQALVYDHTAAKWKNSSTLTANLTGNASTATSASYATTASYVQTAQTASYVLQAVSASFASTASKVSISNDTDNYVLTANGNGTLNGEGNLTFDGAKLTVLYGVGDEGGEILLGKAATNTTLTGSGVTIDVYQNKLRFFEQGGAARGAYIDLTAAAGGVGTNLIATSGGGTVTQVNTAGSVNGITLTGGPISTTGTITLGGTLSGIQSSQLATSSLMIGTTNIALGATGSTLAGLTAVTATSFTGSLLGTASYATQALSASYAPAGNPFPYNGDAQISGSLGITGSFAVQTYDAFVSNAYVDAIRISDGGRAIYDIFGTGSIDAGGRILIDNMFLPSLSWLSRTLYDTSPESSIDWGNRIAYDATGTTYSIDWNNRFLTDPAGLSSLDWSSRELLNSAGDAAITWNYLSQAQAVEINSYTRKTLELGTVVEGFSNLPVYASFKPDGEILKGVALDASVVNFDLVYLNTDNKWYPVDVTTSSSSKLLGIAWNVGTGKETVLIEGNMVVAPASTGATDVPLIDNLDFGLPIYIRTGGGSFYMSTTAPGASGNYVRVLGHAYYQGVAASDYWVMKFRPANDWYVI